MNTSYLFLAEGFEEIEALATVDILRRAGMSVETVSITSVREVSGAHGIKVTADRTIGEINGTAAHWLILPGGLPGATNLAACEPLTAMLKKQMAEGLCVAAICASPAMVLAPLGLLKGKRATCYPGCEAACESQEFTGQPVEVDGQIVTGKGPGFTFRFALAIVEKTLGKDAASQVAAGMLLS